MFLRPLLQPLPYRATDQLSSGSRFICIAHRLPFTFPYNTRTTRSGGSRTAKPLVSCSTPRFVHPHGPIRPLSVPDGAFDILFFGGDEFSCRTLKSLHAAKDVWNTLHVVTQPDTYKTERGRHLVESPVKLLAAELDLQCHLIPKDKSAMKEMRFPQPFHRQMHHPSQLLIVSSLGRFIPWKVLKKFHPSRKLNVHPSLIPNYRGAGPIQWAIADGLEETGVSIIEVEKVGMGYDVGDIWAQKTVPIPPGATYSSLMPILADEGSELLVSVLRNMINGTQSDSIEQDPDQATEAPAIDAQIAVIDWWRWNAKKVEQVSRAITHQKPIYSYVFDHETTLQLFDVSILPKEHHNLRLTSIGMAELNWKSEKLEVQCNSDTQVSIGSVKQKNKKLMPAREWWLGVNEKKKSEGMIQFHMGPWRDETIHPEFKHP